MVLTGRHGINPKTVAKWRKRAYVADALASRGSSNPAALALADVGRIDKIIHTMNFIDGESRRRSTLVQLNLGKGRHALARDIFHGKRGELYQRYREGQEDQLSALGLVVNVVVLWNTIYMDLCGLH